MLDFWLDISSLKNVKYLKKNEELNKELKSIAWYPKRWWNLRMSEDEKKEIEPIFTE